MLASKVDEALTVHGARGPDEGVILGIDCKGHTQCHAVASSCGG